MRSLTYFAAVEASTDNMNYSVFFPDFPGCISVGSNFEEAHKNAQEALGLHIYAMEKDGDPLPDPSDVTDFDKDEIEGCVITSVTVYPDLLRLEMDNRSVRTNTTLPSWLKDLAEANGINYSQVLQSALMELLGVKGAGGRM